MMKRKATIPGRAWVAVLLAALTACGGTETKRQKAKADHESVSGTRKYIPIEDAKEFLPDWSTANIIVYHTIGEPDNMHPTNGNANMRTFINDYIHRFIVASDQENLSVRPDLVESMPEISPDELSFTYRLRTGPTFDDGSPVTVEDVIFSFKANKCPLTNNPHAKPYLENLAEIVPDPATPGKFTMVMKRKYIQNIVFLTDYAVLQRSYYDPGNILSRYTMNQFDDPSFNPDGHTDLKRWANEFNSSKYGREPEFIHGLGAYKLSGWETGQTITLTRKDGHWTDRVPNKSIYETAYAEKIIFKVNRDNNSQVLEFKSQALDASGFLATKTLLTLQQDANFSRNYHSRFTDTYNYTYLAMNTKPDGVKHRKLFADRRVRHAVALLTPVDDIIAIINQGKGTRMVGPVSPLKEECNHNLPLLKRDVEAARRLLDEAGWIDTDGDNIRDQTIDGVKVPFSFDLNYMTTQVEWKDMALMIQEALYLGGLKVNLNPLDFNIHYELAKSHDFDMMLAAWAGSSVPEDFTQIWHSSSWASQGSNYTGFGTSESDALIDSIKYTIVDSLRIPLVRRLQAILYEEQPYVFMYSGTRRNVIHKRFGNANMYFERPGVLLNNLKLLTELKVLTTGSASASKQSGAVE